LESITIRPILGLKTNVPQNDPTLFNGEACHCVDMANVDMIRVKNASNKSTGRSAYSSGATAQHTKCLGLFELKGSSGTDHLYWDNGKFYYVASDRSMTNVDAAAPVTMGTADSALVTCIQVGDYAIFTDRAATLTPYKWKNGDANLTKLIQAGTEYKFRYLAPFQRRIFGAYSDQTNGDIEVRWTQAWTESNFFASACTMAAANQLFKPGNDPISGIKPLGPNACFIYGTESINSIEYFANYTTPFAIKPVVPNHGTTGHHSIVDIGGAHLLFNKHYGFCAYNGGSAFPANGKPISENIEEIIASINPLYYTQIVGCLVPNNKEVCWAVPINGASAPNCFLFYDLMTGNWRKKVMDSRYVDFWTLDTSLIWNDLAALGYSVWNNFGILRWSDFLSSVPILVHGNTDGYAYTHTTEADAGSAWDAYRVEPILSLGESRRALLLEIWFSLADVGNYSIDLYYRGGDTVGECEGSSWVALDGISGNSPSDAVCYTAQNNRYHQLKWGTSAANEAFSVNAIEFKYVPQGNY
jgi:hypothetical protein